MYPDLKSSAQVARFFQQKPSKLFPLLSKEFSRDILKGNCEQLDSA